MRAFLLKKRNESGWYRVSKAFLEFQGAFYFGRRIRQRKEETNMKELTGNQVRQMFLDYFQSKGHMIEPGASLIPHNDPTLLWINAGVAALKKYFDGSEKPACNRDRQRAEVDPYQRYRKRRPRPPDIIRFLRCSATSRSAITSKRTRSRLPGNF